MVKNVPEFSENDLKQMTLEEIELLIPNISVERTVLLSALRKERLNRYQFQHVMTIMDNYCTGERNEINMRPPPGKGWFQWEDIKYEFRSQLSFANVWWARLISEINFDDDRLAIEARRQEDEEQRKEEKEKKYGKEPTPEEIYVEPTKQRRWWSLW